MRIDIENRTPNTKRLVMMGDKSDEILAWAEVEGPRIKYGKMTEPSVTCGDISSEEPSFIEDYAKLLIKAVEVARAMKPGSPDRPDR